MILPFSCASKQESQYLPTYLTSAGKIPFIFLMFIVYFCRTKRDSLKPIRKTFIKALSLKSSKNISCSIVKFKLYRTVDIIMEEYIISRFQTQPLNESCWFLKHPVSAHDKYLKQYVPFSRNSQVSSLLNRNNVPGNAASSGAINHTTTRRYVNYLAYLGICKGHSFFQVSTLSIEKARSGKRSQTRQAHRILRRHLISAHQYSVACGGGARVGPSWPHLAQVLCAGNILDDLPRQVLTVDVTIG